ncbi:hypothetical protein CYMTET_9030 [Cymbomonas tetramitiformis]|uniref:Uncharacterized protein n=1 Tax=Cymbomonas tetramitiformis TaxID=36881 RepID=A0AAE0GS54_9CHLO|nr:hypothetical protein CYMTET_9030 [Cymbomonas tetramitiformis]
MPDMIPEVERRQRRERRGMRDGCECWERRQRGVDGAGSGCVSGVGLRGMRDGCECWERRQRGVDGAGSGWVRSRFWNNIACCTSALSIAIRHKWHIALHVGHVRAVVNIVE